MALPISVVVAHWSPGPVSATDPEADPTIDVSIEITDPLEGDTIDPGATIAASASTGVAAGGERGLIVVFDVSGSAGWTAGGDCTGDGVTDTVLTCEQEAAIEVFERAEETGLVEEIGVVAFAGRGGAGDMSPEAGVQLLTSIDADGDSNGLPDYVDVVRSARLNSGLRTFSFSSAGSGTNYASGAQAACTVAAEVSTENPLVVFLSDGDNLLGSDVTSTVPCGVEAEFQTVAVGANSTCAGDPTGRGSLAEIAALTGGDCTEIVRADELPALLADLVAPEITKVEVTVNGSAPLDISEFATPVLPTSAIDVAWPSIALRPGPNEVCMVATVERGDRMNSATDCVTVTVRGGVEARAGDDQNVPEGSVVQLDGTESTGSGAITTTWTTTEDFETGTAISVDVANDQIALDESQQAFDFIWIAASARGTVVKIDTATGEILGEYWSAPQNRAKDPSRTTVDKGGNVWVGNRAERSNVDGVPKGSVAQIGLVENGQCVDRNGNGVIDTSTGLGDIRPWPNADASDTDGGVDTAADECLLNYVRTNGVEIRHVSVDPDDHVWVGGPRDGGTPPRHMDRIDQDGQIVRSINFSNPADTGEAGAISCCYGGLIDRNGVIWTTAAGERLVRRIDPSFPNGHPDLITTTSIGRVAYGLGLDPDGDVWVSNWTNNSVQELRPDGSIVATYSSGGSASRGVAVTADGDVWVANSNSNHVARIRQDGTLVTRIPVGTQPTGVSVDADGKVWSANRTSNTASRIDPATNTVDATVDLGAGAGPYNYSDMTGSTLGGAATEGTWRVVHDSGQVGTDWAFVDWTADVPGDGSVEVLIATSDDGATFGPDVAVGDGLLLADVSGRFARITVRLTRSSAGESPLVYDVSLGQPSGAGELSYSWRLVDAVGPAVFLTSSTSATPSFVAPDDGTYTFELTVTDEVGSTDTDRVTVVVENVDPVLEVEQGDSYAGSVTQLTGEFTDAGWLDTHTAEIDWGDGTVDTIPVTAQGSGWGSFFGSHVYADRGTYDVSIVLTDDDGGTATASIGQLSVADPIALWANSSTAPDTLHWTSGTSTVDGTVHTNGSLHISGKGKTINGEVHYVTTFTGNEQQHEFEVPPTQVSVMDPPFTYDIADYRPGGPVAVELGDRYVDMTPECVDGVWHDPQRILEPGVYYADCAVKLNGSQIGGLATVAAEGIIEVSGSSPAFQPFYDGLLFLSASTVEPAIKLSSSNSKYLGVVYAQNGRLEIAGSDSQFYCGMYGETISLTGEGLYLRGSSCGRPDDTVAAPLLVPELALGLTADRDVVAPADSIGYELTVTNDGSLVLVPGLWGIENIGDAPVTLSGFEFAVQRLDVSGTWETIESTTDGFELDIRPNATTGVTYADLGPAGTVIDPGALATWGFQGVLAFDAAETVTLLDPAQTLGIRVVVNSTHDPAAGLVRPLYRFGSNFVEDLRALGASITDVDATVLLPSGEAFALDAGSVAGFGGLAPSDTASATYGYDVPVPNPRAATESDAGYLARLSNLDGAQLISAAFVRATGGVGQLIAPIAVAQSTEELPVVSVASDGPSSMQAGTTADFTATISNVGSSDAPTTDVVATADDDPLVLVGAPTSMVAGEITEATTTYDAPTDQSGPVDVRVSATWSGANGVTYGPLGSTVRVDVLEPAELAATMTATLVDDADGDGFVSPGDTLRYLGTVTNSGGVALTGVTVDVTPDTNTPLVVGSVTTTTGTVASGNAAGETSVAIVDGTVAAGGTADFAFDVTVTDPWPQGVSTIEATGTVSADGFDPVPTDDPNRNGDGDPTRTQVVVPFANAVATLEGRLAIDRDGNGVASSGDRLEYELVVQSTGSRPVTGVTVTVPVPAPGTLVADSVETSQGTVVAGGDLVVEVGDLDTFDSYLATVTFAVDIADGLTDPVDYTLQGVVSSPDVSDVTTDDPLTTVPDDPTVIVVAPVGTTGDGGGGTGGGGSGGGGDDGDGTVGNGLPGPTVEPPTVPEGTAVSVPTEISAVIAPVDGTTVDSWTITHRRAGTDATGVLASDDDPDIGPILVSGTFDPTVLPNGTYEIIITAIGSDGGGTRLVTNLTVEGDYKPGRFELTFDDLTVQVPGLPIRVLRKYDSFDTASGDFGRGWTLESTRLGLATSRDLSSGWFAEVAGCSLFLCSVNVLTNEQKKIYVTWPDGKIDTFELKVNPYQNLFPGITTMYLEGEDGNRAEAELVNNSVYYVNGRLQQGLFGIDGDIRIDQLVLNVPGGSSYRISKSGGLLSSTSPSGEVLTYSNNGVVSTLSGTVVQYVRDAQGRITQVVGPNGAPIDYVYNAEGELESVTNAAGESTSYTYNDDHVLLEALDAYGKPMRRVTYDEFGRVESITDANGNTVQVDLDLDNRQQIITDAEGGYTTITSFDEAGNIVQIDEIHDGETRTSQMEYDDSGNMTRRVDPLGNEWLIEYDANGDAVLYTAPDDTTVRYTYDRPTLPSSVTDQEGQVTRFEYLDNGQPRRIIDHLGNAQLFEYDARGRLFRHTDREGHATEWTYDSAGRVAAVTEGGPDNPGTVLFTYDSLGNPLSVTRPGGGVTTMEYDAVGNLALMRDPLGNETSWEYDLNGRLLVQGAADGNRTTFVYDDGGRLESATDVLGNQIGYTYDLNDRIVSVTDPGGLQTLYERDGAGRVTGVTDELGNTTRYEYDALNRTTAVLDPLDRRAEATYDAYGRPLTRVTPTGATWSYEYDGAGRLIAATNPLGEVTARRYDELGRLEELVDRRGFPTSFTYDDNGLLDTMVDSLGGVVDYDYDAAGRITSVTDPLGIVRGFEYDNEGNLVAASSPAQGVTTYQYDALGQPIAVDDPRGFTIGLDYDPMGRITDIVTPQGTITHEYDQIGRRIGMTDLVGTSTYTYDDRFPSRLSAVTTPQGVVSYTYDEIGRRASMSQPEGTVAYDYDAASQLTSMVDWSGNATSFDYTDDGLLSLIERPNGISTRFGYDAALRVDLMEHVGPSGVLEFFDYTLDENGNRTSVDSSAGSETYELDELGRLRSVTYPDGQVAQYTYDALGNRLTETIDGTTTEYDYNAKGQLVSDGESSYTYDDAGNTLTAGDDSYEWDWSGQMTSATVDGEETTYDYDGDGVRVGSVDSTGATEFVWDRASGLPMLVSDGDVGHLQLGGMPFATGDASDVSYQLTDALGSVRATTSQTGAVTSTASYDVWGATRQGSHGTFGFAGEQTDPTGLIHLRARQYNPQLGRFLSADTVQPNAFGTQGWNLYSYAANNPSTLIDPSGNVTLVQTALIGAVVGGLLGAGFGLLTCRGQTDYAACVLREGIIGAISGVVAALLGAWAFAALATGATSGWGVASAFLSAEFLAAAAESIMAMLLRGEFDPLQALIDGLIGAVTAGVLNSGAAGRLMDQLGDLFSGVTRGACSFEGATMVLLADGTSRRIDELRVGDWVMSYEPETGRSGPREVTATWVHGDTLVDLVVGDDIVATTPDHPFWNATDRSWQRADELDPGDRVRRADGSLARVGGLVDGSERTDAAYNLTVEQLHTYFVAAGDGFVLVHNTCDIRTVNGRNPINSGYAGGTYDGPGWTPELQSKYPDGVTFTNEGFPDFSPYAQYEVEMDGLTGNYATDANAANAAVGIDATPDGYVWHHVEDGQTMQLIPQDIHQGVRHTGGSAVIRESGGG